MKIKMTSIPVEDPISAHRYYTEVLGFKSHTYMPEHQLAIVMAPDDDTATIILEPISHDFVRTFKNEIYKMKLPYMIFDSKNVKADYDLLIAKGVTFKSEPKTDDWGTSAIFDDQHGTYIQIHQDL